MFKTTLIFLIILLLKIQTLACSWSHIEPSLLVSIEQKNHKLECKTLSQNETKKIALLKCSDKQILSISYENNKIHFLTQTQTNYPYLSQCWVEGTYDSNCKAQLQEQKCQVWDLRIY